MDILSIYRQEDELQETMNKFKFHQDNFNMDFRRCIYYNEKVITYLSQEVEGLSQAVKNLDKHSRVIETQCSQISETQSLILAQLDKENLVSTNEILTHSGKRTHDPKGPDWYEKEQERRRTESQSQTQESRELLFGEEEPEEWSTKMLREMKRKLKKRLTLMLK